MHETLETFEVGRFIVKIYQDEDPIDPRKDDNLGTMVSWHRDCRLGDEHAFASSENFLEWLADEKAGGEDYLVLPLYLYDHSIQALSTVSFVGRAQHAEWDSGQVGYVYISHSKIKKEYSAKRIDKKLLERVAGYLRNEVETYSQWMQGDVYGYVVEDSEENELDSCWGFYGIEEVEKEARAVAERLNAEDEAFRKLDEQHAGV